MVALPAPAHQLWLTALRAIASRRPLILGYHGVAAASWREDPFLLQLSPERFHRQLELLSDAGFRFTTVADLLHRTRGAAGGAGVAAISFDDGLRNNLTTALPILQEFGVPATVYVPSGWLGGRNPWIDDGADNAILTSEELRHLSQAGWEVGAHTVTHADLSRLDYAGCLKEIQRSCADLQEVTGRPVTTLAYPFGRYGAAAVAAARAAGLLGAVTTGARRWDPFELPRAMVGAADPNPVLFLKFIDRYEPLVSSLPLRGLRRLSKRLRGDAGAT